jgi:hypothetical protein
MKFFVIIIDSLLSPDCGMSGAFNRRQPRNLSSLEQGRIINGRESPRGAWPWQVSILVQICYSYLTECMNTSSSSAAAKLPF